MNSITFPQNLLSLVIRQPEDLVIIRQRARQIMTLLGYPQQEQTQMTTAISEIVRNAYQYAGGGKITLGLQQDIQKKVNFTAVIADKGLGIKALDSILQGHYVSETGKGLGIVGAKRIVKLFSIDSTSEGTTVLLGMLIPDHTLPITHVLLSHIANHLAVHRPKSASEEVEQQNQDLLIALEKLTKAQNELEQKVQQRTLSLQTATEHLHLALQSAHAGTWHWHSQSQTLEWDAYTCKLFGLNISDFANNAKVLFQCLHPDDRPTNFQRVPDLLKAACEKTGREFRILWPDGFVRHILARGQTEYDERRRIKCMRGIFWDVTERKQADVELHAYQLQAAQVQRITSMGEMASALAHELNQPLTAISAFARGCLRRMQVGKEPPENLTEIIEEIAGQSERAGDIMHRIKNFARKGKLYLEPLKVNVLIENITKLFSVETHNYAIKINTIPFSENLIIFVDKVQIEQVFLNLLRNSLEAMQAADIFNPTVTIEVKLSDKEMVEIMVKDNGPGFSNAVADKLFEAYFTTKSTGMGMGLAICRTIVEAHAGKLIADSISQQGSCFRCLLPIRKS